MKEWIPLSIPNLRGKELEYVTKAIETGWVSTAGPYVEEFEERLSDYVKTKGAVACQSGTAGLHLALLACKIQPGEEVIVPTLTFIAAVNPIKYIGATPIFLDCEDSLTMDPIKLERFCEEACIIQEGRLINKNTHKPVTAVIVVHIFGNMADMETIKRITKKYHLCLIEDATEALGTYYTEGIYQGAYAGTIGDIGVYSFNGNKILTTGGGGMIVSNHPDYLDRCRYLSTQAKKDALYFIHEEIGYNYRMTNIQAALGLAQLEQLEGFIATKKANYNFYQEQGIRLLEFRKNIRPNYWFYSYYSKNRDSLIEFLSCQQIQSRPIWKLIHTLKPYIEEQSYEIEKAMYYYEHIVNLPCSSNLEFEDIIRVVSAIKNAESRI